MQRQHAAGDGKRNARQRHDTPLERIEEAVKQSHDQRQADGNDDHQAFLGQLQVLKFARPEQAVTTGQMDVPGDPRLGLRHRAPQIPTPHTEFDRDEALRAFVVDPRGPGVQGDRRQFAQRDVGIAARRHWVSHLDFANAIHRRPELGPKTDHHSELAITLEHGGCRRPTQRRLDYRTDVPHVQTVPRRFRAIHLDIKIGLAEDGKDSQIGHPPHLDQLVPHLRRQFLQSFQIRTNNFDRIGPFHSRNRLFDIVLNVLGEIEGHARQFIFELPLNRLGQFFLGHSPPPFPGRPERHK